MHQKPTVVRSRTAAGVDPRQLVDIPREYPELIRAGTDYLDLTNRPGWKRLLDDLESRANAALASLRQCESNDPAVIAGFRNRWREAESSLEFVQKRVYEAINHRKEILAELQTKTGLDFETDEYSDLLENEKLKQFINGQQGR